MKLGFQGWYLSQPTTGIGQHSLGLLTALAAQKNMHLTVVTPTPLSQKWRAKIQLIPTKKWLLHPALKKWFWERIQVPAFFAKQKFDWEYYPYPSPLPRRSSHRRAMTVHDLILWNDPRYRSSALKSLYHKKTKQTLKYMDQLFAVSKTIQKELALRKVAVLPNGLPELPKKLRHLPYQNDLIYLGGYDLRKRVPELVNDFLSLPKTMPQRRLLLIGEPHHHSYFYPAFPQHKSVKKLGKLSEEELYSALKSAFAFVHFSDSEGFNLPLLQAMAVGTPAIVRDLPIHREVSKGAALFHNGSLSASLKQLENPKKRKDFIQNARRIAKKYTWKNTAKIFLKTLQI